MFDDYEKRVRNALRDSVSVAWDGCHKIYIHENDEEHYRAIEYGYGPVFIEDIDEVLDILREWWDLSCALRFIQKCSEDGYQNVIGQFEDDEGKECE